MSEDTGVDSGDQRRGFEGFDRLWTPHRLAYIKPSEPAGHGCPFCAMQDMPVDESLVVTQGELCFVVLNLHPYNPGHLMVVPNRHIAWLTEAAGDELTEIMQLAARAERAIREAYAPNGLNMGLMSAAAATRLGWPMVVAGVTLLWTVGILATLAPALRASRISPAIATRNV